MTKNKENKNTKLQNDNTLENMYTTLQKVPNKWNISREAKKKIETVPKTAKLKK